MLLHINIAASLLHSNEIASNTVTTVSRKGISRLVQWLYHIVALSFWGQFDSVQSKLIRNPAPSSLLSTKPRKHRTYTFFSTVYPSPVLSSLSAITFHLMPCSNSLNSTTTLASLGNVTASNAARFRFPWPSVKDPKFPYTSQCITLHHRSDHYVTGLTTAMVSCLTGASTARS